MDLKAVSQLLWPDKDHEEWFSLGENHGKDPWLRSTPSRPLYANGTLPYLSVCSQVSSVPLGCMRTSARSIQPFSIAILLGESENNPISRRRLAITSLCLARETRILPLLSESLVMARR